MARDGTRLGLTMGGLGKELAAMRVTDVHLELVTQVDTTVVEPIEKTPTSSLESDLQLNEDPVPRRSEASSGTILDSNGVQDASEAEEGWDFGNLDFMAPAPDLSATTQSLDSTPPVTVTATDNNGLPDGPPFSWTSTQTTTVISTTFRKPAIHPHP